MTKTKKQPYEAYFVYGDFAPVMDDAETIDIFTATAVDKDGADATADVLESGSIQVGTDDNVHKVFVRIIDGVNSLSPYKFTIKIETSTGNKWEIDGIIKVKEI